MGVMSVDENPRGVRVARSGGSRLVFRRPVFTNDGKYLLCASGDLIKVFNTATGETLHELTGHGHLVTGIQLNPNNYLQAYSSSEDGTIKLWDYMDGILIKTFLVHRPLLALYTCVTTPSHLYVFSTKETNSSGTAVPGRFQLLALTVPKSPKVEVEVTESDEVVETSGCSEKSVSFSCHGEYLAFVQNDMLGVFHLKKKKWNWLTLKSNVKKKTDNTFVVVACHPTENCIATGHVDGRIRLWRNFWHKKEYTFSTYHWHSEGVSDLAYSAEGTCLLTGGPEAVLVQWRHCAEEQKDFLPRLGAPISSVSTSPCGALLATGHVDNKITIVKSNLFVVRVIQGLVRGGSASTGLIVDPRSKALALNGKPGYLQFYSLGTDELLYDLDIVQQEHIFQRGLVQTELHKAAFDELGDWLATVEQRAGGLDAEPEIQLKFWAFDVQQQSFVLNTTVAAPHDLDITAVCFRRQPPGRETESTLVTCSLDGRFKVWTLARDPEAAEEGLKGEGGEEEGEGGGVTWSCDFVGSFRKLPATTCCFSEDGSVLAVAFGSVVTLWEPECWEMRATFCQPPGGIRQLCFGNKNSCKYLVGATDTGFLHVWNLLSCWLEWSVQLSVAVLVANPLSDHVAVFTTPSPTTDLFVFRPSEARPVLAQRGVCPQLISSAVFVPRERAAAVSADSTRWLARSQLYFLNTNHELLTVTADDLDVNITPTTKQLVLAENIPATPFSMLLQHHRRQQQGEDGAATTNDAELGAFRDAVVERDNKAAAALSGSLTVREMLSTPAHVLPPASVLCNLFVTSLLISKKEKSELLDEEKMETDGVNKEADSDVENDEPASRPPQNDELRCEETEGLAPTLSRSEAKRLKRLGRTDFGWMAEFTP
ncbi:WD repeat-containing protein 75 [Petromyzon marinus]|uniref:WD repeat-containing protein 75 n=1 Tax=Petromyzon marinus TaxID=7757 RepID=UPI003F6F83DA